MARALLKEKPKAPETRRVRFHAPVETAALMDMLVARAEQAGFELDLDAALAEAYAGLVRKLERELTEAGVAVETAQATFAVDAKPDDSDDDDEEPPRQPDAGATSFGTAA